MASMTLGQFAVWYRPSEIGDEGRVRNHRSTVKVLSPHDLPVPDDCTNLPTELALENGSVMLKRRRPRLLDWGPQRDDFSQLMLFQVLFHISGLQPYFSNIYHRHGGQWRNWIGSEMRLLQQKPPELKM